MKRLMILLLAVACLAMPVAFAEVPVGDHISHVAADGSYRDNARGVWVDACGLEHPLCPTVPECPVPEVCPEVIEQEPCADPVVIALECPSSALTADEIHAIAIATVAAFPEPDDTPDFVRSFNIQAVIGGNSFRGIQARNKWFGMRVGRLDLSNFHSAPGVSNDPLDPYNSELATCKDKQPVCHEGHTIYPATEGILNGHLDHGDTLGECPDPEDPEDPFCGDGNLDVGENCENCPEDAGECQDDPDPFCGDGNIDLGETCGNCPEDVGICDDPINPVDPKDLGWKRTDDTAESLEAFVYLDTFFKGKQRECFDEDNNVRALCRLGVYVGGGIVRIEETRMFYRNGYYRSGDDRHVFKPTATIGVDYNFPFRLAIGAGYNTEAGLLVHAGYGVSW